MNFLVDIFKNLRDQINSTDNHPQFSLRTAWIRGGREIFIRRIHYLLLIIAIKFILLKPYGNEAEKFCKLFGYLSLFFAFACCPGEIYTRISFHWEERKDKKVFLTKSKETWGICDLKYWVDWFRYYREPYYFYPNIVKWAGRGRCKLVWERGLKWHLWYIVNRMINSAILGIILLIS